MGKAFQFWMTCTFSKFPSDYSLFNAFDILQSQQTLRSNKVRRKLHVHIDIISINLNLSEISER